MSLAVFLPAVTVLVLGLVCYRFTVKTILMFVFPLAAITSYFMNTYNIVVDTAMLTNVLETDSSEALDLLNPVLFLYLLVFGLLPALLVYRVVIVNVSYRQALISRFKLVGGALITIVLITGVWGQHYASFFREHKILRYYANPVTPLYSIGMLASDQLNKDVITARIHVGLDAKIPDADTGRELIIVVLGETARADHFSLNGYARKTNPQLENYPVINFPNVYSCATSTAISLPCMFSLEDEKSFDMDEKDSVENLLDVLAYADVDVLWRDNNSDSKGVAVNIKEEDFRDPVNNPVCDTECRDIGMLSGLEQYIEGSEKQDLVIVLHQMGNHGPAYYKRYPQEFEIFSPTCKTNNLEQCSIEEINNAYDNAIVYTDYFLSEVITFLQDYDDEFETAMFYISDHGESLGEYGLFLHGMPNFMAPDEQRHVPALMWFGENYDINRDKLIAGKNTEYSHDNFFHTVLSLMEIETAVYDPAMDLLQEAHL